MSINGSIFAKINAQREARMHRNKKEKMENTFNSNPFQSTFAQSAATLSNDTIDNFSNMMEYPLETASNIPTSTTNYNIITSNDVYMFLLLSYTCMISNNIQNSLFTNIEHIINYTQSVLNNVFYLDAVILEILENILTDYTLPSFQITGSNQIWYELSMFPIKNGEILPSTVTNAPSSYDNTKIKEIFDDTNFDYTTINNDMNWGLLIDIFSWILDGCYLYKNTTSIMGLTYISNSDQANNAFSTQLINTYTDIIAKQINLLKSKNQSASIVQQIMTLDLMVSLLPCVYLEDTCTKSISQVSRWVDLTKLLLSYFEQTNSNYCKSFRLYLDEILIIPNIYTYLNNAKGEFPSPIETPIVVGIVSVLIGQIGSTEDLEPSMQLMTEQMQPTNQLIQPNMTLLNIKDNEKFSNYQRRYKKSNKNIDRMHNSDEECDEDGRNEEIIMVDRNGNIVEEKYKKKHYKKNNYMTALYTFIVVLIIVLLIMLLC